MELELKSMRESVGIYDASRQQGHLRIEGPDAASYLQRMLTNEVLKLPVYEGRYNALLDRKGMVRSLFYLYRSGETEFRAITPSQLTQKTYDILTRMKLVLKVTVEDLSKEFGLLWLIGPKAEGLIGKERVGERSGGLIWKDNLFGPPVWNISGPSNLIQETAGGFSARAVKLNDESIRLMKITAGFPEYGVDVDESHILLELNLPCFYQRQKGCYPGQEVIERILAYGKGRTPRSLCLLEMKGKEEISHGTEIQTDSGEKAGATTSTAYDPLEDRTLILAYLERYAAGEGLRLTIADKEARRVH